MKKFLAGAVLCLAPAMAIGADTDVAPSWAYLPPDAVQPQRTDDGQPKHVPGSDLAFTTREIGTMFGVKDWFPNEHPPMPDVVQKGRKPAVFACGLCHLSNGLGHPESANLAGDTVEYLTQQLKDFQNDKRHNVDPARTQGMVRIAKALTDDEIKAATEYFSQIKPVPFVKIKEATMVPTSYIDRFSMRFPKPDGGMEPLGQRIIELPEDADLAALRDPHSGFIAYVPVGSVKKGEALVTTGGNGKTIACSVCHGDGLKGLGNVPRIAGLHPVYIVRQLIDIKHGSRDGTATALMKPVVAKLTDDDIIDVAAYVASLNPS